MKKDITVIGSGVSGLVSSVYLQSSGFNVTIYEQHSIPGGLSTGWKRKGYFFEGGMHWLTGSSEKMPLNRVWKEIGALQDNNPIFYRNDLYTLIDGNTRIILYRNIDMLRKEFLRVAPEDIFAINKLYKDVKTFLNVHLMINDIHGLKTKEHIRPSLSELISMVPAGIPALHLMNVSYEDYISMFKNKNLRHLLRAMIGTRYNALSLIYTIASFASGDCGFPEGGSIRITQNIANTFCKLGGKIIYNTKVQNIKVVNKKATGIIINDNFIKADNVVVATDTRSAIDTFFENKITDKWANYLRKNITTEQNMFVCLGVKSDLSKYPRAPVIPLDVPFEAGGLIFSEIRINNYAADKGYSPTGCTAITCLLLGDSYKWWKAKKLDGTYSKCKEDIIKRFINIIEKTFPETIGNIDVTDLATPCTYERYTSSFEGSWMSVWKAGSKSFTIPAKSKDISNVYFASERSMMPGGLPICAWSGRRAAQTVCKDNKTLFVAPKLI